MKQQGLAVISVVCVGLLLGGCATQKTQIEQGARNAANVSTQDASKAAYYNVQLGMGYLGQGDTERAKRKLLLALSQEPKSVEVNGGMAYFQERTGNLKAAKRYYQRAIALAPTLGGPLNNYGTFLCRQKQFAAADTLFKKAVKDPNYLKMGEAYENAGLCARAWSKPQLATQYFKLAVEHDPKRVTSLYELSRLKFNNKQYKQANQYLAQLHHVAKDNAETAWLSYQVSKKLGQAKQSRHFANVLKTQFNTSKEFKNYQASLTRSHHA